MCKPSRRILDGRQVDYRLKPADRYRKLLDVRINFVRVVEHLSQKEVASILSVSRPELAVRASQSPEIEPAAVPVVSPSPSPVVPSESVALTNGPVAPSLRQPQYMQPEEGFSSGNFFGSAPKAAQKPKTDDFDFDFESAFATGAVAPVKPVSASRGNSMRLETSPPSKSGPGREPVAPRRDLTTAKAISSDDFKPREERSSQASANNLARFKNAQGISSEAYFGTEPGTTREGWVRPKTYHNQHVPSSRSMMR